MQRDEQTIGRQDAFALLLDSLRSTELAPKPAAISPIEAMDEPVPFEIPCQDCDGTGGDGGAIEGWEPCPHCNGSGVEPEATVRQVERAA